MNHDPRTIDAQSWPDRHAIVAPSMRDRGSFDAQSRPRPLRIDGTQSSDDRGHQLQ